MKRDITLLCRTATTFATDGGIDEDAMRQFLQRFVDANLGVYLASGGSGEGHSLEWDEIRRIYQIGVEVCKGKVPVNSNQPERRTAKDSLALAMVAAEVDIDVINIYGPGGWHGYRPTEEEFRHYFDHILAELRHPVALCPNPVLGYTTSATVIADICNKYPQIVAVNLSGISGDRYFINLQDALKRDVEIYVPYPGSIHMLDMGATGLLGAEANLVPKTFRKYIDLYEADERGEMATVYAQLRRVSQFVEQWKASTPRWIKLAMKAFRLPGWEGGVRDPYLMPGDDEVSKFATGAIALGVPEIDELAQAAGLRTGA